MSQQPPESDDQEKPPVNPSRKQDHAPEDERFVLVPEAEPNKRRWLSREPASVGANTYEPRQFDLSSLPDEAEVGSNKDAESQATPPVGYVSEPRPVQASRRPPHKPVVSASSEELPPLGFVSEARPVRPEPQASASPPPRLGFISRNEIEKNARPADMQPPVEETEQTEPSGLDITPPLGYVSEPVVIARRPVEKADEPDAVAALFENQQEESGLPPLEAEIEPEVLQPLSMPETPAREEISEPAFVELPDSRGVSGQEAKVTSAAVDARPVADDDAQINTTESASASEEALTAGGMLRHERLKRGLTQEDIVLQTHMTLETVKALEEDRDPPQSAWVYVRGFYRRYAKALGIPEEPLLEAHQSAAGQAPQQAHVSLEWAPKDVSPKPGMSKHLLVVFFSIALGVLAWWLLPIVKTYVSSPETVESAKALSSSLASTLQSTTEKVKSKSSDLYELASEKVTTGAQQARQQASRIMDSARGKDVPAQTSAIATVPEAAPAQPEPREPETMDDYESAEPYPEENALQGQSEPATSTAQPVQAVGITPTPESSPASQPAATVNGSLELALSRQSWVSVTDGNGQFLFEGMLEGGVKRSFEGLPPLVLFLGTATAVDVRYNGQDVEISSHLRPNGTARIELGGE